MVERWIPVAPPISSITSSFSSSPSASTVLRSVGDVWECWEFTVHLPSPSDLEWRVVWNDSKWRLTISTEYTLLLSNYRNWSILGYILKLFCFGWQAQFWSSVCNSRKLSGSLKILAPSVAIAGNWEAAAIRDNVEVFPDIFFSLLLG